ncbi:hypothetical protein HKX48_008504 [Thoreauomyces humboldtii]|nr:hypothetical protein HKX48_008504 [Thoreauomyces humboldtii]
MRFYIATTLLITASSVLSLPTLKSRQSTCDESQAPSTSAVQTAINNWNNDVINVNSFLNSAASIVDSGDTQSLIDAAQTALNFATDEPTNLATLAAICDVQLPSGQDPYSQAVATLQRVFPDVPARLQDIINNAGDASIVHGDVDGINQDRCCFVLPSVDTLFSQSAPDYALVGQVSTVREERSD